jgi:iron complex outermembrane receptor protein
MAVGEESLTPDTDTTDTAVFILQEWHQGNYRIEGGVRAERREIDVADYDDYSDWAYSYSLGSKIEMSDEWSLGLLYSHAERHPTALELYADGPHAATRQFEEGDSELGTESANSLDLSLHYNSEVLSGSITAFNSDFSDYIYANPTDEFHDGFRVYQFTQVDTTFQGFESELLWHVLHMEDFFFDIGMLADLVDTDIKNSADHLPRIPPVRVGGRVLFGSDNWMIRSSLRHSFKQDDTAPFEEASAAYTNWSAALLIDLPISHGLWHLIISGDNLLNEEIRSHTSPLKDIAPAPGRSLRVNLSATF